MHRLWVDDITTLKATNSITANINNDLNLTGAAILSDNLVLAVTGDINKKDLIDSYYSENMGINLSASFTTNGNQAIIPGTGGQPNTIPGGATTIEGSYAENESNRTVYATIGGLNSQLTSQTSEMTNGDFEGSLTVDHRLLSEDGRDEIKEDLKNLVPNLMTNPLSPPGFSVLLEEYTGHELTWESGGPATYKLKGDEYGTLNPRANNVGLANVTYDPKEAGAAVPQNKVQGRFAEGSPFSNTVNSVPGMNSIVAIPHDKFGDKGFFSNDGPLQLSIIPFIPVGYYGLIGKSIRNAYEESKTNNETGVK